MKEINVLLTECSDKFSQTGEFRILKTYRTRDNRLSFDERLSIIKSVERAYEPLFELIKNDAPNLTDSDLIFYALSVQRVEKVAIAECLTVSPDAIRMRKLRLREKLPSKWFELVFPEQRRNSSESVTSQTVFKQEATLPLPAETTKNTNSMKEKLSFGKAVASCFKNYLTLKGRARRSEYWYFILFCFIVMFSLELFQKLLSNIAYPTMCDETKNIVQVSFQIVVYAMSLALLVPTFSVTVRRLHDLDDNGWSAVFICLLPWIFNKAFLFFARNYISAFEDSLETLQDCSAFLASFFTYLVLNQIVFIVQLVLFCKSGTEGPNSFGPDPVRILPDPSDPDADTEAHSEECHD